MSSSERAIGRAAARIWRSIGNTFSIHQRATSGNDSSRSVSPVGAQSTTIASQSPDSCCACSRSSENSSSIPGGTVSSSAEIRSTPRSMNSSPSQSWTPDQWRSISSWALTSWPHRSVAGWPRLGPELGAERLRQAVRRVGRDHQRAQPGGGAARGRCRPPPRSCRRRPCPCRGSCAALMIGASLRPRLRRVGDAAQLAAFAAGDATFGAPWAVEETSQMQIESGVARLVRAARRGARDRSRAACGSSSSDRRARAPAQADLQRLAHGQQRQSRASP